jgi:hypothetical protein
MLYIPSRHELRYIDSYCAVSDLKQVCKVEARRRELA